MKNLKTLLITLETDLFKHTVRASYQTLDKLLADDFIEIASSGITFGKQEALDRLPSETAPKIYAINFEIRQISSTCAQLLYQSVLIRGSNDPIYSKRCSIWTLNELSPNNKQWQMSFHQGTLCEAFKIKDNV